MRMLDRVSRQVRHGSSFSLFFYFFGSSWQIEYSGTYPIFPTHLLEIPDASHSSIGFRTADQASEVLCHQSWLRRVASNPSSFIVSPLLRPCALSLFVRCVPHLTKYIPSSACRFYSSTFGCLSGGWLTMANQACKTAGTKSSPRATRTKFMRLTALFCVKPGFCVASLDHSLSCCYGQQ